MLLGCCHCGEQVSESVPPSESNSESMPSHSVSDSVLDNQFSVGISYCNPCVAVPRNFTVTLSGWGSPYPSHLSCCGSINGSYSISADSLSNYTGGGVTYFGGCNYWRSSEKCRNHNSATNVAPSCARHATRPLIELVSILKTNSSVNMRYALTVWSIVPGGFGSVFSPWVFEGNDITDLNKCLYPTLNATASTNSRCSAGTVTLVPL